MDRHTCSVLSVLWSVERQFSEQEVVVLWLCSQVLEDALLHKTNGAPPGGEVCKKVLVAGAGGGGGGV